MSEPPDIPRAPRHYVSYVRERLIAWWKIQAVIGNLAPGADKGSLYQRLNERALAKRVALFGDSASGRSPVWPWAFQLGPTATARALKKGDVLWIIGRTSGLSRRWPPSLVARMTLAEDAVVNSSEDADPSDLPFPYHFGVTVYSGRTDGEFFPANDATVPLYRTGFATPLECVPNLRALPASREVHETVWRTTARKGFYSLRRVVDPSALAAFAHRLSTHSVFISYRWRDHPENSEEFHSLCGMAEELLVRCRMGVWLDRLTLPASEDDKEDRRKTIAELLKSPLKDSPVVLARVTGDYAGLSGDSENGIRYTLLEWESAHQIVRWNRERCRNEGELAGVGREPVLELPREASDHDVARALERVMST